MQTGAEMKTSHFFFKLPEELIAQHPSEKRGDSRLMLLNRSDGSISHHVFSELPKLLPPSALLVLNNSKVRKARLNAETENGGTVEFLLLGPAEGSREADSGGYSRWKAMVSRTKRQRPGKKYIFPGGLTGEILSADGPERLVEFSFPVDDAWLDKHGHMPLPPYIRREDMPSDSRRYQTVYSERSGSIAAPTAGLHFTPEIIAEIESNSMETAYLSLHVGRGTFLPVRTEYIRDHKMHSEQYEISPAAAELINRAVSTGKKITAVGTTSVRTLESEALRLGRPAVEAGTRTTDIFIYPGSSFSLVSHMITNFHTPESSLLMLVSAFAGKQLIDRAYSEAIKEGYRFYSYGDAMLIL